MSSLAEAHTAQSDSPKAKTASTYLPHHKGNKDPLVLKNKKEVFHEAEAIGEDDQC